MIVVLRFCALVILLTLTAVNGANAHPHVFVTAKGQLRYGPDGTLKAIRYAWTFDAMFSAFASQGLDTNGDGKLSREELADLAKTNVDSLKEFGYFTVSKRGEKPIEFGEPTDYWLEAEAPDTLTLHFTLPVKTPGLRNIAIEVYDPTYFIAFSLADGKAVSLEGAPAGCVLDAQGSDPTPTATTKLSESFFTTLQAGSDYGEQFANRIAVRCP
jgi:ABC-type uncharacterized transport system substrate-binding protein